MLPKALSPPDPSDQMEVVWTFSELSPGGRQGRALQFMGQKIGGQHGESNTHQGESYACLLYTSPSPRDRQKSRMPSSA